MILGLDISTSITGYTLIDKNGKVIVNDAIDTRKYKNFFEKAQVVEERLNSIDPSYKPTRVFIEQSLQSFRSGFSSAKTLSTLARFNGIVSWMCYKFWDIEPEYIAATSARKKAGITVPKGVKGKDAVMKYVVDNVPDVLIEYTKHNNPKPHCFDKADSWVIARAGWLTWQSKEK